MKVRIPYKKILAGVSAAIFIIAVFFAIRGVFLGLIKPMPDIDALGPRQLVLTYYKRLALTDTAGANRCLADDYRRELADVSPVYTVWLGDVKISEDARLRLRGMNSASYDERQYFVEYSAWQIGGGVSPSGQESSFVYVAKKTKTSPWRIICIGSGP
ncbi:MAG: hypothetical protein A2074_01900 [Candidatus Aquicultor primus]|uniref:DUF4829 domain-containing protein n=1 Tax=Candidatus Aquicultor primus TaxID=1797195 RepID=A0A1F2UH48_9ACTN|nr:MAG: hypothetical protein A2074_01900 [Candidatus Aquicultor primus]